MVASIRVKNMAFNEEKGAITMEKKDDIVTYELKINKTALKDFIFMCLAMGALAIIYDLVIFLPYLLR